MHLEDTRSQIAGHLAGYDQKYCSAEDALELIRHAIIKSYKASIEEQPSPIRSILIEQLTDAAKPVPNFS